MAKKKKQAAHSKLGASSLYRWKACPGSVKLCEGIPEQKSKYAEEGTFAHDVAAKLLESVIYKQAPRGPEMAVPEEMLEAVNVYVGFIQKEWQRCEGGQILIEHKFDLSTLHPDFFGTADCVIYDSKNSILKVFDYKHGAGIPVEVVDNPQLKYYALGALLSHDFKAKTVEIGIVQPRCSHPDGPVRIYQIDAMDLLEFSAELIEYAKATESPDAPLVAGSHCKFCVASATCPKLHETAMTAAKTDFTVIDQHPMPLERVAEALHLLPTLKEWIKNVEEFGFNLAKAGNPPPGFKLVEGRGRRKWRDENELIEFLSSFGLDETDYMEKSLKSPAQMEKVLGKKQLDDFIMHQPGSPDLVPVSDKREAIRLDAKADFEVL